MGAFGILHCQIGGLQKTVMAMSMADMKSGSKVKNALEEELVNVESG